MGLVKNGFIDLENGFFINESLVKRQYPNGSIELYNGEIYQKGELSKPDFLMNGKYCYDLYGTIRGKEENE